MNRYKIFATYKRKRVVFVASAATGAKAVAQARRMAKSQGMNHIFVNFVRLLDKVVVEYTPFHDAPLAALGGTCDNVDWGTMYAGMAPTWEVYALSVDNLNAKIESVWNRLICFAPRPDRPPLKAYEFGGKAFVDDGVSGRQELYERSPYELAMLVYDWLIYAGYYSDDLEQFIKESWAG